MTDPRDFDRRMDMDRRLELEQISSPTPWGWIAGGVFIAVLLALVFASNDGTRTARDDMTPPATTGMAPKTAPPAITVPPSETPSTTGRGGTERRQ
jgi:hypothetical protein